MSQNPKMRGTVVEIDGSLEDLDHNADALEGMGVYEASLERALLYSEITPVSALLRNRLGQDGLIIR